MLCYNVVCTTHEFVVSTAIKGKKDGKEKKPRTWNLVRWKMLEVRSEKEW
jgi:hypothetical protein